MDAGDGEAARALARRIAARLGGLKGVGAVVLGGSWARGAATTGSDIDLGIYYDGAKPPAVADMRELARKLEGSDNPLVTERGEWGPWVNGGAWLEIEGREVDWLYREIERVARVIGECSQGRVGCDYSLGHPHGFHNHIYLAEIFHCEALHDPEGVIGDLKSRVSPYPAALKREIIRKYLFDSRFMLDLGKKSAGRGDVFHVAGCLFRCIAAMVQVLFALNERYFMNEKGAVAAIDSFPLRPAFFAARSASLLGECGCDPASLAARTEEATRLLEETEQLCGNERA
jgi:predicted nucleotidyltransferase